MGYRLRRLVYRSRRVRGSRPPLVRQPLHEVRRRPVIAASLLVELVELAGHTAELLERQPVIAE